MALRHPIISGSPFEAYEGLVYSLSALAAHYPGRSEAEISGTFPWTAERLSDGLGGTMFRSRVSIVQTQGRDGGKGWNFVDNSQYALISALSTYPSSANFAVSNSRDWLRLAIYFAKACVAHYPQQRMAVAYPVTDPISGERRSVRETIPLVSWTDSQLADGRPYCAINCDIPLIAAHDGVSTWQALNLTSLPTNPIPALIATFASLA